MKNTVTRVTTWGQIIQRRIPFSRCGLRNVDERHFNGFIALGLGAVVVPVFKVMLVPALVVHPCGAVTFKLTLCLVGAAAALIHFAAYPEFLGAVF